MYDYYIKFNKYTFLRSDFMAKKLLEIRLDLSIIVLKLKRFIYWTKQYKKRY